MAYNLQSLITILEQILNPQQTQWVVDHNKPQLQSLLQKATSLQQILDKSSLTKIESLEIQIRDATHKTEDIIESHMVYQMLSTPQGVGLTFSTPDLQQVMQQLDSVMEQVMKLVEGKTASTGSSSNGASFSHDINCVQPKAVVGVDADLRQLTDRLIGMQNKLEMVPIVGMGGIGKTTLARKLYEDPSIVSYFQYAHAWATISQEYNMKAILLSLLRCIIGKECDQHADKKSHELKDILYRSLYGRRYLIVLDDIWSIKFWDEIRMYLPDNNKGSRIVITTRESDVAKHANSQSVQHQMQLLSKSESWDLLRQTVFGEEGCPDFLQRIGEKIVRDCGGLPLAISVIGGLLSKVERSKDGWENIANNVAAEIAEADQHFSNILSLSYNHLPNHLKPCFLYMGVFLEDYEIEGSKLVHMWVAEGYVKSNKNKSLEEVAEDWLKALIERNLFLVREYRYGKPRLCGMHDLLRDLCIRKCNEDQFVYVKNGHEAASSNPRRVCVHRSVGLLKDDNAAKSMSLARSFIIIDRMLHELPSGALSALRLLRVLDLMDVMSLIDLPEEIFRLVNLRFLGLYKYSSSSRGILGLRNLRTFIARYVVRDLPPEIFEMSELRHLQLKVSICIEDMKKIAPNKLQSIFRVELTDWLVRSGFLESIPDIENLGIRYCSNVTTNAVDLRHLHKLKTLRLFIYPWHRVSLSTFRFPRDLRKLVLNDAVIVPSDMTTMSALPNLEVLQIDECEFVSEETCDEEWEVAEGLEFCSLQFLHLSCLNLVRWRADESNFPRLRELRLEKCWKLVGIPSGIGEIPTLQLIELKYCSNSLVASGKQIVEEQQSEYGNYHLKLHITYKW